MTTMRSYDRIYSSIPWIYSIVFLWLVLFYTSSAYSQNRYTGTSRKLTERWHASKLHADSLAHAWHLPIRINRGDTAGVELQRFERNRPRYYKTNNLNAAISLSTDKVWPGGSGGFMLNGASDTIGEWDEGAVRTTHQEFQGRVLATEGILSAHSTHVAGTLIAAGLVHAATGMSNQAQLLSFDWNNDIAEMDSEAALGLKISNHSYGLITGWDYDFFGDGLWVWFGDTSISQTTDYRFGFYDDEARTWDSVAYLAPNYLIVKAAGNDRGEGPTGAVQHWIFTDSGAVLTTGQRNVDGGPDGFNCLNGSGVSKNILTIGAVNDVLGGYSSPDSVYMTSFSSWGPTDDGRIKPDIVANGVLLFSTYSSADNAYAYGTGTSMASPNASGSIALLIQYQKMLHGDTALLASTLKGLVIQTADECGPTTGPDYMFGWGLMNTLHAAQLMRLDSADGTGSHIIEGILHQADTVRVLLKSDGREKIKATLCWTDPPGISPQPSYNPPDPMLVNDLDLRILRVSDMASFQPWVLNRNAPTQGAMRGDNSIDNVEQVLIDSAARGYYTLMITHKGTLSGGLQKYSLLVSGNTSSIGPYADIGPDSLHIHIVGNGSGTHPFVIHNSGDLPLQFHRGIISVPWLQVDVDSGLISPGDSSIIHCTANAISLRQDSSYSTLLPLTTNDISHPVDSLQVIVSVLGPTITIHPPLVTLPVDSGGTVTDTLWIMNTGVLPLQFTLAPVDSFPLWLTISGTSGLTLPQDSTPIVFRGTAGNLHPNDYVTHLLIHSNDSAKAALVLSAALRVGSIRTIELQVANGWNLVSMPLMVTNNSTINIFPQSISDAFLYSGAYIREDSLSLGHGYWLRFNQAQGLAILGTRVLAETIQVSSGWNLIGSLPTPIPVDAMITAPQGIIQSRIYSYISGYSSVDTLYPGYGYWVKVGEDGSIILNEDVAVLGGRQHYIHTNSDLPPPPPDGESKWGISGLPDDYALEQAYPNPFNPTATIEYSLPSDSRVSLKIYNLLGQLVQTLSNDIEPAGFKQVVWNASNAASGIYFYRLEATSIANTSKTLTQVKKMILLK